MIKCDNKDCASNTAGKCTADNINVKDRECVSVETFDKFMQETQGGKCNRYLGKYKSKNATAYK